MSAARLAMKKPEAPPKKMEFKLLGHNYTTPDLVAKVTGKAKYAEDYRAEGMVFVKLMPSPRPHAKIRNIDASAALAMPGVHGILTAKDLPAPPPPGPPPGAAAGAGRGAAAGPAGAAGAAAVAVVVDELADLDAQVQQQKAANQEARRHNELLSAEVSDLKEGLNMVEERARHELGMVKPNEIFVHYAKKQ